MILILLCCQKTATYIIDYTTIKACQNKRRMNMLFKGKAKNSKSSMDWRILDHLPLKLFSIFFLHFELSLK